MVSYKQHGIGQRESTGMASTVTQSGFCGWITNLEKTAEPRLEGKVTRGWILNSILPVMLTQAPSSRRGTLGIHVLTKTKFWSSRVHRSVWEAVLLLLLPRLSCLCSRAPRWVFTPHKAEHPGVSLCGS